MKSDRLGGKPISRVKTRFLITVGLPLVLGGCGLPVGIQIASLLADGISFVTTDKTLTDHGISAVAKKDCAIWRGLKGEDICRNSDLDALSVAAAAEPMPGDFEDLAETPAETVETGELQAAKATIEDLESGTESTEAQVSRLSAPEVEEPAAVELSVADPVGDQTSGIPIRVSEIAPVSVPASVAREETETKNAIPPIPTIPLVADLASESPSLALPLAPITPIPERASDLPAGKPQGGTFLIIASYHRAGDAKRFARGQSAFDTTVLAGRAKGRSVYRVAVGPVAKARREEVRSDLVDAGFTDVWPLRQETPEVIVQLAAVD